MSRREYKRGLCFHFLSFFLSFKYFLNLCASKVRILFSYLRLFSIKEIPELFIIGRPDMTIIALGSDILDIFEVNDIMSSKGWHLNALQRPNR